jgi:hypothetical protein
MRQPCGDGVQAGRTTGPYSAACPRLDPRRNTGALGPLLAMLQDAMQSSEDSEKLRLALDTLAFLLLDRANRKLVAELNGMDLILSAVQLRNDSNVHHASALDALVNLVRGPAAPCAWGWKKGGAGVGGRSGGGRRGRAGFDLS